MKTYFPKNIWFGGLEHECIILGGCSTERTRGECEVFYLWESLSSSIHRDYTRFSGGWRNIAICFQVTTFWEESDLFSISIDFCRSSQMWGCLNIVVFLILSCNVIRPLQAAHGVWSLVCLLVPTEDIKLILACRKKAKYLLSLCVPTYIFLAKIQFSVHNRIENWQKV